MSHESPVEDALSDDELTALLAEAEGTTPEAIERGAAELELSSPAEATVTEE